MTYLGHPLCRNRFHGIPYSMEARMVSPWNRNGMDLYLVQEQCVWEMIIIWRVLYIFVFLTYFWDFWHCCCLDARCSALIVLSHPLSPHKHHTLALLPRCTYPCTVSYLSHKIPYHSWHFSLLTSALSRHKKSRHFFLHHPLYLLRHKRSLAPGLTLVRCQEEVSQTRRREGYVVTHTNGETSSHDGINTYLTWYFHMGSGSGSLEDDAKKAGGT